MVLIMDELIELVLDLLLEGGLEINSNKKVSKWIRYPIIVLLTLIFTIVIIGIFILGIFFVEENILVSLVMIIIGIIMLVGAIKKIKKYNLGRKEDKI